MSRTPRPCPVGCVSGGPSLPAPLCVLSVRRGSARAGHGRITVPGGRCAVETAPPVTVLCFIFPCRKGVKENTVWTGRLLLGVGWSEKTP